MRCKFAEVKYDSYKCDSHPTGNCKFGGKCKHNHCDKQYEVFKDHKHGLEYVVCDME